jgi:AdoMet-dependent heme synthase
MTLKHTSGEQGPAVSLECIRIPHDVCTKTFRHESGEVLSVIYRTRTQAVAVLEGDSAEVWTHIYGQGGRLNRALDYILQHGQFTADPETEARATLAAFLDSLAEIFEEDAGLEQSHVYSGPAITEAGRTAERTINLWMADHHILYSLVVELTYRCNERCVHCYCPTQRDGDELSLTSLCELVEEFESMGGFSLQLTGGELFLRKDTKTLLRFLRGRGLLLSIISNLTLLDEETVELLNELSPRSVGCSIYSADATLHDAVTTIPGSFERSIRSIRQLREAGVPVVLKTPLMKDTVSGWRDVESLAEDLGCSCQFDLNITARNDGGCQPLDLRVRDEEMIRHLFATRFNRLHIQGEALQKEEEGLENATLCGAGANGLAISPAGNIHPCIGLPLPLGRYPADSLKQVWETSEFFESWNQRRLFDIPQCRECYVAAECFRCPGAWYVENGDFMSPNEYTCFLAGIASTATTVPVDTFSTFNSERR